MLLIAPEDGHLGRLAEREMTTAPFGRQFGILPRQASHHQSDETGWCRVGGPSAEGDILSRLVGALI